MKFTTLSFNGSPIKGWVCSCGEKYYDPKEAQRILLLNKLKKENIKVRLGQIRSNLILRLPRDVEKAFSLEKGKDVIIKVRDNGLNIGFPL